jgi:hypothetical protein
MDLLPFFYPGIWNQSVSLEERWESKFQNKKYRKLTEIKFEEILRGVHSMNQKGT